MTQIRPHLFLKRLVVVTHTGKVAYDEAFHKGVNIIRGRNSSGKSTIANFIFYVLGGDFSHWTTEAIKCREVYAEVDINGAVITLKRNITEHGLQPMNIFWGTFDESKVDTVNWQTYPYKQSESKISFSRVIFNALEFPEVRTDADSTITLHQLLRLLYIDQDTSTQSLFRAEKFDPPLTRQTIAEVLLGIYDDSLYKDRIDLRNAQKDFDSKKSQFEGINRIYGQSGGETNINKVKEEIELAKLDLANITETIQKTKDEIRVRTTKNTAMKSEKVQESLFPVKETIRKIKHRINQLELDTFDSGQFIETLQKRVNELDYSLLTRKVFGELPLTHCPQCLNPMENHVEEGNCSLCKQPIGEEAERAQAKRLKQEMELQIKESESLLSAKLKEVAELKGDLPNHIEKARLLQKELDIAVAESQSTRDERIDTLLIAKGGAEKKIEYLTQQIKAVEMLELLKKELAELTEKITLIKLNISSKESQQEINNQIALNSIKKYTIELLRKDLPLQGEFRTGQLVEVNFSKDTYSLDGGNNFSASSKTYFKNSVLYAIFFASLELDFFRYPRFILCDNMEDKGMEKERTQNFQNQIVAISQRMTADHQIIFTTSMVSDELNNNVDLCVGEYYDQDNKTLKV